MHRPLPCIAGVGGNMKKLVKLAKSERRLIAIDGCPLACCKACLAIYGLKPHLYFDLSLPGVLKGNGQDFDETEMQDVLGQIGKNTQNDS